MIKFLLMVNKLGQTRLCQYYDMYMPIEERSLLEAEIIRKCISRRPEQCAFLEHRDYKVVYRRYASLYLIVGAEGEEENEMALLELIHNVVETLDRYFENVVCILFSFVQHIFASSTSLVDSRGFAVRVGCEWDHVNPFKIKRFYA
eukprot:c10617_g1_i1.p1 GENE.c10617_g1_i1~~c10617_g1_i1.p1  ORF type:complete len:157 (-),score=29.23 c10617_g1_i1:196-633(-)